MRIAVSDNLSSITDLLQVLKKEFSSKYSFRLFGIGEEKTLIVKKTFFVGVQITKKNNELNIDGVPPSAFASLISILLQQLANLFIFFHYSRYQEMEKEISSFIKDKYSIRN